MQRSEEKVKATESKSSFFSVKYEEKEADFSAQIRNQIAIELIKTMQKVNLATRDAHSGVWYYNDYYKYCEDKAIPFNKEYQTGFANPEYWEKRSRFTFRLKKDKKPSEALQDFLNGITIADCGNLIVACQYAALLKIFGEENFNLYFNDSRRLVIEQIIFTDANPKSYFYDIAGLHNGFVTGTLGNRPLKFGDMCHIGGVEDYLIKHPAGAAGGWNVIFTGKNSHGEDLFLGFHPQLFKEGPLTERELYNVFIEKYNLDRNIHDERLIQEDPIKYDMITNKVPARIDYDKKEKYLIGYCSSSTVCPDFANIKKHLDSLTAISTQTMTGYLKSK